MGDDIYQCEQYLSVREFSDIKSFPELRTAKKRINLVETRLIRKTSLLYDRRTIQSPEEAVQLARLLYQNFDKEYLFAVFLTSKGEPICIELLSIGSLESTILAPRDIVKTALLSAASGYIIFHNHPSGGEIIPSAEDISITRRLNEACKLMNVKLYDHIILSDTCYVSLKEREIIN